MDGKGSPVGARGLCAADEDYQIPLLPLPYEMEEQRKTDLAGYPGVLSCCMI